jgi:16S rRNA (cytidine1402-2'-O)-methyltransferase
LLESILGHANPSTRLCIASEITSANEFILTKTIEQWKKEKLDLHKKPVIFLLQAQAG